MWVSCATKRCTRCSPNRTDSRSIRKPICWRAFSLASKLMVAGWVSSASTASSRIRSKPKPGSSGSASASSRWRSRRSITLASRIGSPVLTAMRSTLPSARKNTASSSRAPRPWRSRISLNDSARPCSVAVMASWVTTGSAKRRSAIRSGKARRGVSGFSSAPRMIFSCVTNAAPSRSDNSLCKRAATAPMVFSPAWRRARRILSSQSSAASGSGAVAEASWPGGTMAPCANLASTRAAKDVPAMAARTTKPWAAIFCVTSRSIAVSPPNRCAAPVMSR